jgi:asparagine synthase (glutamine-hydrolysing)
MLTAANEGLSNQFKSEREAIQATDSLLHKTVSMQQVADVGVGTFLSGGIDSSLVSAVAQSESSNCIKTFTIGFEEKEYDESAYAEEIAQHLGTDHKTVYVNANDALEMVPKICRIYDEPFADASQIPTLLVSEIAREDVTVCLSGDGGDELFAGYNRYNWSESIWSKVGSIPLPVRKLLALLLRQPGPEFWDVCYKLIATVCRANSMSKQRMVGLKLQKLSEFIAHADIEEAYRYLLSYWNTSECLAEIGNEPFQTSYHSHYPATDKFIEKALFWDQINYLPGDNLAKVDRASMAVSLETRLPLLSHEMVELSWRIPQAMKVKNGESKWLLKQVLYKYIPGHLVERPKMGFSVPIASWLRNELREWASDLLTSEEFKNNRVLNQEKIHKAWTEHLSGRKDHALRLWAVLMFLSWNDR